MVVDVVIAMVLVLAGSKRDWNVGCRKQRQKRRNSERGSHDSRDQPRAHSAKRNLEVAWRFFSARQNEMPTHSRMQVRLQDLTSLQESAFLFRHPATEYSSPFRHLPRMRTC